MQTWARLLTKSKTPRIKMIRSTTVRLITKIMSSVWYRTKKTKLKKGGIQTISMIAFKSKNLAKKTTYLRRAMRMFQAMMLVQLTQPLQLLVLQSNPSMLNAHQGIQGNTDGRM